MCWKCGNQRAVAAPVPRSDVCPVCGADTRACKNCAFYSPGAHYDCRETVDEAVRDKERANFCGNFSYNPDAGSKGGRKEFDKAQKARGDFAALFK